MRLPRYFVRKVLVSVLVVLVPFSVDALDSPLELAAIYASSVDKQLSVPADEAQLYADLILNALKQVGLGRANSKGCIRIPASLNQFIDHYGLLDADYERALLEGESFWMLSPDRSPTPWSGRYLIIVDSMRETRPTWTEPKRQP
jgi:hypothetical protein